MSDPSPVTDQDVLARFNASRTPSDVSIRIRDVPAGDPSPVTDPDVLARFNASGPSLGHEVAAVAASPVKGVADLAGLPGDITQLAVGGARSLGENLPDIPSPDEDSMMGRFLKFMREESARSNKAGINQAGRGDQPGTYEPVTSSQLKESLDLPNAETGTGKVLSTIGEFAPAALVGGGGGVGANLVKGAVLPGAGSELLGGNERVEGTWLEPYARLVGALGGGVAGIAGGKGVEAFANRAAASNAAKELGGAANPAAVRKVANSYEADQLTPAAVADKQAQLGPEAMMLDMGRQLQIRAEAMASQGGKGQNMVLDPVQSRVHGFDKFGNVNEEFGEATANRIKDTLDTTMGPSPDIVAYQKHVNGIVDSMATPLYDTVMNAHPVVNVPGSITSRPAVAEAMKRAVGLAKNYGEELEGPAEARTVLSMPEYGVHIAEDVPNPAKTSLRYWDYVKKSLDQRIRQMKMGGDDLSSAEKADLGGLQAARSSLVNNLDTQTGGAYARARAVAATKPQVKEAIEFGRNALNSKLLPEEMADEMHGMSVPEQAAFKAGFRREVERIIDTARNDGAAARRELDINQNRQKIVHVFGQDAADALDDRITAETRFQTAANKIAGSARTGLRSQITKDTEAASTAQPPMANLQGLALAGVRRGREYLGDVALDRTRQGIADLVTRQGSDIPTLARILSGYNAARAANAGPTVGRQVGGLASVLASQTPRLYISPAQQQGQ